jgi:hypothetical protein
VAACGFAVGSSENTAIAQGNADIAKLKANRPRDLTINALTDAVSPKRDGSSSARGATSGIERSAHENGDAISTQRATISDDMDMISIDKPTISAAELSVSDDMDMISIDEPAISAAELNVSDDMGMISTDRLTISAAELSVSDDMGMIKSRTFSGY